MHANTADIRRNKSYLDIDARIARKFQLDGNASLRAFLEVNNVLNRRNQCCTEYDIDDDENPSQFEIQSIRSLPLLA